MFTMIELLVVIAVIMILVALLMPTLGKVKYRARLVTCMNNQRQIALASVMTSGDNDNRFPERASPSLSYTAYGAPFQLKYSGSGAYDDRPDLEEYVDLNTMECPFIPSRDISGSTADHINWGYSIYSGWRLEGKNDAPHFTKPNDGLRFNDETFDVLVADKNVVYNGYTGKDLAFTSHPDRSGTLELNGTNYIIRDTVYRGPVDLNMTRVDGSTELFTKVGPTDNRFTKVRFKLFYSGTDNGYDDSWLNKAWSLLPATDQ